MGETGVERRRAGKGRRDGRQTSVLSLIRGLVPAYSRLTAVLYSAGDPTKLRGWQQLLDQPNAQRRSAVQIVPGRFQKPCVGRRRARRARGAARAIGFPQGGALRGQDPLRYARRSQTSVASLPRSIERIVSGRPLKLPPPRGRPAGLVQPHD